MTPPEPLAPIRVLDLTRHIAGPVAVNVLRQLGAEIIRVEAPDGSDPGRRGIALHSGEHAPMFYALHRGKRSIALDLKNAAGRAAVLDLAARCDVFVENQRPGALAALGLGWEQLRKRNPRLVYCSISGFGATGPMAQVAVTDGGVQAFGGVMYVNAGRDSGPPGPLTVINVADVSGGLYAAQAILAALYARERTGEGVRIDMSLLEPLIQMLPREVSEVFAGDRPSTTAHMGPVIPPLRCEDGRYLVVQLPFPHLQERFRRLVAEKGASPTMLDERFATPEGRIGGASEYVPLVVAAFSSRPRADWVADLQALGIPSGPVNNLADALASQQLAAREGVVRIPAPESGELRALGNPFHFEGLTVDQGTDPPPYVGEHSEMVLREVLRYGEAEIAALRAAGALDPPGSEAARTS
jgi:crotonobetainyl-CoA:carnitine CoA-transferase CaiB-like acyl-CoA transferase